MFGPVGGELDGRARGEDEGWGGDVREVAGDGGDGLVGERGGVNLAREYFSLPGRVREFEDSKKKSTDKKQGARKVFAWKTSRLLQLLVERLLGTTRAPLGPISGIACTRG